MGDCSPLKGEQGTQANYVHLSREVFKYLNIRAQKELGSPKDASTNPDSDQRGNQKRGIDGQPDLLANIMKQEFDTNCLADTVLQDIIKNEGI